MKLPRNVSGDELMQALSRLGYRKVRQKGAHARATTSVGGGEHHVTIPMHSPIKPGTLRAILRDVADHHGLSQEELLERLFD